MQLWPPAAADEQLRRLLIGHIVAGSHRSGRRRPQFAEITIKGGTASRSRRICRPLTSMDRKKVRSWPSRRSHEIPNGIHDQTACALWLGSISQHLNTCRLKIDLAPLADAGDGPAAHECGLVIQWLSDLDTRWTSNNKHDFFTVWGSLRADSMKTKSIQWRDTISLPMPAVRTRRSRRIVLQGRK